MDKELVSTITAELADEWQRDNGEWQFSDGERNALCDFAREVLRRYLTRTAEPSKRSVNAVMVAGRDVDEVKQ